jgi:hypothetical protein
MVNKLFEYTFSKHFYSLFTFFLIKFYFDKNLNASKKLWKIDISKKFITIYIKKNINQTKTKKDWTIKSLLKKIILSNFKIFFHLQ